MPKKLEKIEFRYNVIPMTKKTQDPSVALEILHHVEGLISLGENRANIVAAGNAGLIVVYSTTDLLSVMFPTAGFFGYFWPVYCALLAFICAGVSLFPQLKSTLLSVRVKPHSYYFGCIGDMKEKDFITGFMDRDENDHVEMILKAVHMRSRKAKSKFTFLAIASVATVSQFLPAIGWVLS